MLTRIEFDKILRSSRNEADKVQRFGAVLAGATGLGRNLVIVGGSAITVYTEGRYTSGDIDVLGSRDRIVPVLKRWVFEPEDDPDGRRYWTRPDLGLLVDILHRPANSGPGRSGRLSTFVTDYGPVRVSAIEDLIVRGLMKWSRGTGSTNLDQAVDLFVSHRDGIDTDYLEAQVRYERVQAGYAEMVRLADTEDKDYAPDRTPPSKGSARDGILKQPFPGRVEHPGKAREHTNGK